MHRFYPFGLIILLALITAFLLLRHPKRAESCGPMWDVAVFSYQTHPDFPLDRFAAGHLEIIKPTFARSYLTVAYRYLSGHSIDAAGRRELVNLWHSRMEHGEYSITSTNTDTDTTDYFKAWKHIVFTTIPGDAALAAKIPFDTTQRAYRALEKYLDRKYPTSRRGRNMDWTSYIRESDSIRKLWLPESLLEKEKWLNRYDWGLYRYNERGDVYGDAFRNAVRTYRELVRQYGTRSPEAIDWLYTEDTALSLNVIPSLAAAQVSTVIANNRQYLHATGAMYNLNFNESYNTFQRIAQNPASPWHTIAPYLAVRAIARKAWHEQDTVQQRVWEYRSMEELHDLLARPDQAPYHDAEQRLLNALRAEYEPMVFARDVAASLMSSKSGPIYANFVGNYTSLLDRVYENSYEPPTFDHLPQLRPDDITDWVMMFQVNDPKATVYCIHKWEQTRSLPWLLSAVSKVDIKNNRIESLIKAAEAIPASSPAYITAQYHLARLAIGRHNYDAARERIDSLIERTPQISRSSRNDFAELRTDASSDFQDFLHHLERRQTGVVSEYEEVPSEEYENEAQMKAYERKELKDYFTPLDEASVSVLNSEIPTSLIIKAIQDSSLSNQLRERIAVQAWTRAIILHQDSNAILAARALVAVAPKTYQKPMSVFLSAPDSVHRTFEATYILGRWPGFSPFLASGLSRFESPSSISSFRFNWWCSVETTLQEDSERVSWGGKGKWERPRDVDAVFLNPNEQQAARSEYHAISACPNAPDYLCKQTIAWAKAEPNDPRIPEALHNAIRATRYGCTDKRTGDFSQAAFALLHKRYAKSVWARKTKYWFN